MVAGHLTTLIRIAGSKEQPVTDIRISGVGMRDAAPTFLERWGVPSGGDWACYHGAGDDTTRGPLSMLL